MEIERKWHMLREPDLPVLSLTRMYQSYLSLLPEVRIRRYEVLMGGKPDRYDLTIKSEGTLAREEIIKDLTAEEYRVLRRMIGSLPPPSWFGEETTEQQTFRMKTCWRDTRLS